MTNAPDKTEAPEALPQRVDQADHVALVQAQGRKLQAEQALQAAAAQLELAHMRHQLAQRELEAAETARAAAAAGICEKYRVTAADTITTDGAIWRAA